MNLRLKKLDKHLLGSFIGPFIVIFFVVLFAFVMQNFWLYMDELLGKGLGYDLILQLMLNMAATLTPVALPLAILLAGIMTFGGLGEHFELVAIKSSGISLFRFMRPLVVLIAVLSVVSFLFVNFIIPEANLKSFSLMYDMRNAKPTMNIKPGVFNRDLEQFSIRVGAKDKDGMTIHDILIYDHSNQRGNNVVIAAESGKMIPAENGRYLIFELENGWRYEENNTKKDHQQTRMHFEKWYKTFDLSKFSFSRTKEDLFKSNELMMNVAQLQNLVDSTNRSRATARNKFKKDYGNTLAIAAPTLPAHLKGISDTVKVAAYTGSFLSTFDTSEQQLALSHIETKLRTVKGQLLYLSSDAKYIAERQIKLRIELNKKFSIPTACLLLFFIGAPIGAIIRKGGIGLPIVVSILFFVVYFILTSTFEKLAKQGAISPFLGMWMSTFILTPVAIFIVIKARNDAALFSKEAYTVMWRRVKEFIQGKKNKK